MKVCKKSAFPLTAIMVAVTAFLQVIGESYSAVNSWNRLFENPAQSMVRFLIVFLFWYALLAVTYRWCERPFAVETHVPYKIYLHFRCWCWASAGCRGSL